MKLLEVPYFENIGNRCSQTCMKSAVKYFLDKDISLEKLDELTGRREDYYTWQFQSVSVLYELGLDVKYYSGDENIEGYLRGEDFIKESFPKDLVPYVLKVTDFEALKKSVSKCIEYNLHENRLLSISEIKDLIEKGFIVLVTIDYNKMYDIDKPYSGHFIVLTGFDDGNFYYHENQPGENSGKNKRVSFSKFSESAGISKKEFEDIVVIFGKRN